MSSHGSTWQGVRVIMAAPGPVPLTANVTARREWVESALEVVRQRHMDGVVFDFEDPLPMGDPRAGYYAQLINETTRRFHQGAPRLPPHEASHARL